MLTEKTVQKLLSEHWTLNTPKVSISNVYYYEWESDFLIIDLDNQVTEFEIKVSKWDYLADAKKYAKHEALARLDIDRIPNRFYYAVDKKTAESIEVPEYAGLVVIHENGMAKMLKIVKKAADLHREVIQGEGWENIAIKLYNKL